MGRLTRIALSALFVSIAVAPHASAQQELTFSLETALESEAQAQAICMQHPDYREAYQAFIEKRPPRFSGAKGP